jgi:hypothetical protein
LSFQDSTKDPAITILKIVKRRVVDRIIGCIHCCLNLGEELRVDLSFLRGLCSINGFEIGVREVGGLILDEERSLRRENGIQVLQSQE